MTSSDGNSDVSIARTVGQGEETADISDLVGTYSPRKDLSRPGKIASSDDDTNILITIMGVNIIDNIRAAI